MFNVPECCLVRRSNIMAYWSITQEAVKNMPDRSSIINICSIQAVMPMPGELQWPCLGPDASVTSPADLNDGACRNLGLCLHEGATPSADSPTPLIIGLCSCWRGALPLCSCQSACTSGGMPGALFALSTGSQHSVKSASIPCTAACLISVQLLLCREPSSPSPRGLQQSWQHGRFGVTPSPPAPSGRPLSHSPFPLKW